MRLVIFVVIFSSIQARPWTFKAPWTMDATIAVWFPCRSHSTDRRYVAQQVVGVQIAVLQSGQMLLQVKEQDASTWEVPPGAGCKIGTWEVESINLPTVTTLLL